MVVKGPRLPGPQLQISPVERDLERDSPLLSWTSQVSDLAMDGMGLASDLETRLVLLVVVSFARSQEQEDTVGESSPYFLLVCRTDNPEHELN